MRAKDIVIGGLYIANVSGKLVTVRVDSVRHILETLEPTRYRYDVTNLSTNRKLVFRSAAKFRMVTKMEGKQCANPPVTADRCGNSRLRYERC